MNKFVRLGLGLGGAALCGLAFLLMRFDRTILSWIYIRPPSMVDVVRPFNYPGSWMVMIPMVGLALTILWRPGWIWLAVRPMGMYAGATLVSELLKYYLRRARPPSVAM